MNMTMMNTMHRATKTLALLLVFCALAAPVTLQARPGGSPGNGPDDPALMAGLNLTDKQIELLKSKRFEQRKTMISLRSQQESLHADLAEAASANKPDLKEIDRLAAKIGELHGQMTAERIKGIVFLRSILSKKQQNILDTQRLLHGMKGERGIPSQRK